MYLLDTNIVSYWMRRDRSVIEKVRNHRPCDLFISTITLAEILFGIEKSPVRKCERRIRLNSIRKQMELLQFDESAAIKYAGIRAYMETNGIPISERDLQIASIALANELDVITHNVKEFGRVPNLRVIDWADK